MITKVEAGERIKAPKKGFPPPAQWADEQIVQPPCDNKTAGQWYCVTHNEPFYNNFEKDGHITQHGEGDARLSNCRLAWQCFIHGFEQP